MRKRSLAAQRGVTDGVDCIVWWRFGCKRLLACEGTFSHSAGRLRSCRVRFTQRHCILTLSARRKNLLHLLALQENQAQHSVMLLAKSSLELELEDNAIRLDGERHRFVYHCVGMACLCPFHTEIGTCAQTTRES